MPSTAAKLQPLLDEIKVKSTEFDNQFKAMVTQVANYLRVAQVHVDAIREIANSFEPDSDLMRVRTLTL